MRNRIERSIVVGHIPTTMLCVVVIAVSVWAQPPGPNVQFAEVQISAQIAATTTGRDSLPSMIERFSADAQSLQQRFRVPLDPQLYEFQSRLYEQWQSNLTGTNFETLKRDDKIDYLLLANELTHRRALLALNSERDTMALSVLPYSTKLIAFCVARENTLVRAAPEMAQQLQDIADEAKKATDLLNDEKKKPTNIAATTAIRAGVILDRMQKALAECHNFYQGYDPQYAWWAAEPYKVANQMLLDHSVTIRRKLANIDDNDTQKIVGQPIGAKALAEELRYAMIAYTPEELIRIADKEFAFCDAEFAKAANELGMNGDWHRALEYVKSQHVEPGAQPALIRELAWEAIRFVEANDLITIPELAKHDWRLNMLSPEDQRQSPYFLGGQNIMVSFPTDRMTHAEKLMSLRSNNIHFCRATVHHELIPGHHLQFYMMARYRPYRQVFDTPFWTEGWALYWEMLLWDLKFAQGPEDRIGMLFWRRHRCARIQFSLNYHLGKWTPEQCVQYLIDRVGHEPSAATAEVRRSVMGDYSPLYQAGYMLGGLQIRRLSKELVAGGKMSNRAFHDAVIQQNSIPIEMVRASLTDLPLAPKYQSNWRFAD